MKLLTGIEVVEAPDVRFEDVLCPEWGADVGVRIRSLSAEDRVALMSLRAKLVPEEKAGNIDFSKALDFQVAIIGMAAVDDGGEPIFNKDQVKALRKKNPGVIDRLGNVAMRLAGLTQEAAETAVKN